MATVHVTVNRATAAFASGAPMPVLDPLPLVVQTMTDVATATTNTTAVPDGYNAVWNIVSDGAVWLAFGETPTAASGSGHYLPAGIPMQFAAVAGQKVSVKDA